MIVFHIPHPISLLISTSHSLSLHQSLFLYTHIAWQLARRRRWRWSSSSSRTGNVKDVLRRGICIKSLSTRVMYVSVKSLSTYLYEVSLYTCNVWMYIYIYTQRERGRESLSLHVQRMNIYWHMYSYRERERESLSLHMYNIWMYIYYILREREGESLSLYMYNVWIYIYIYTYIERGRESLSLSLSLSLCIYIESSFKICIILQWARGEVLVIVLAKRHVGRGPQLRHRGLQMITMLQHIQCRW